jgi:farnesyl-diphosphate farnesyltransferase
MTGALLSAPVYGGMLARAMSTTGDLPLDELLQGVSRTFALSIPELPMPLGRWVGTAYLVCRIIDTVEDRPGTDPADRRRMFDELIAALGPPVRPEAIAPLAERFEAYPDSDACGRLMQRAGQVLAEVASYPPPAVDALVACALEMIEGFRETPLTTCDRRARFLCRTLGDLERYCHYAAGVVGVMLARLFALHLGDDPATLAPERLEQARRFGRGLQLTNIVKDHPADLADGRVFIPPEAARQCGLDAAVLMQPALPLPVREVIVSRAAGHLDEALDYTLAFPLTATGIRLFCLQPLMMALLTLDRVLTHVDTTPDDRPRITREQVADVLATSRRLAADNDGLRAWYARHRVELGTEN